MRFMKGFVYLTAIFLLLVACSSEGASKVSSPDSLPTETNSPVGTITNNHSSDSDGNSPLPNTSLKEMNGTAGQLYGYTFEAMMQLDENLNTDMKYIAVDLNPLTQLTEADKLYILNYLEQKFSITVQDNTLEQLIEKEDLKEDLLVLEGTLLRIEKVELGEDTAVITGSKFRSGTGSVGTKIELILENDSWKVASAAMTWIS
ncbi:hypothetical protein [Paenibacillus segetis]|uniref:Uncharacterized protein n=1 Tax=Paenibacillus segetis TaxID=1325360 RepID=A0ABQ1YTZ5_9BACL|nr:hypothetical protein [Paenibacillus segetis]GGH37606.1 hypothetical protein GCM10008013_45180 [Paenibacillus segetis]